MKKMLLIGLLLPVFSFAQCDKLLGGDVEAAKTYMKEVEKILDLKLTVDSQPNFMNAADADGYASVRIQYDVRNQLKNGQQTLVNNGIKRIHISGPWDKIEQLYNEYFLPRIKGCRKAENEQTDTWEGHRLQHVRQGQQKGVSLGYLEITKG